MDESWGQLLTSTVVAAVVSGAAIVAREMLSGRWRRAQAAARFQDDRARHSLGRQEVLLREMDWLWRQNGVLRVREAACRQRCRALGRRVRALEQRSRELRRRLDELSRVLSSENANLQEGNTSDR